MVHDGPQPAGNTGQAVLPGIQRAEHLQDRVRGAETGVSGVCVFRLGESADEERLVEFAAADVDAEVDEVALGEYLWREGGLGGLVEVEEWGEGCD